MPSGSLSLALSVLLVFGAAKLLGELFERFHQPGITGEILAGVLIGPSVLHWVTPSQNLNFLAQLGVMFLLFRVGLELKTSDLARVGRAALLVGIIGVVIPVAAGWGLMFLWGKPPLEAVFVGAALAATSVGITAQVLAAKRLLDRTASRIILAAAIADDVLALLLLSIISSMASGEINVVELALAALFAIAFILGIARWGSPAVARIALALEGRLRTRDADFALAMILLFGLAALSERAGVAPIIGAFLAGLALSDVLPERAHTLTHGVTELLLPFFLAGIGLSFNLAAFATPKTLVLSLLILAIAVLSKLIAGFLGSLEYGRAVATQVGFGMIPRGEFCMVVAQIGLTLKVIPPDTYGTVVFMAVCTTVITPPLLKFAFREK